MPDLDEVSLAVLDAFAEAGIPYALAGGLSANTWVKPEHQAPTFDVDVALFVPEGRPFGLDAIAEQVGARLNADCFHSASLPFPKASIERLLCGDVIIDVVLAPAEYAGTAMSRVGTTTVRGTTHPVLDPNDVVLYKALARRDKDIGIIRAIAEDQEIDRRYIEAWARALGVWGFVKKILWPSERRG